MAEPNIDASTGCKWKIVNRKWHWIHACDVNPTTNQVNVANASGSITLSTPQDITFDGITGRFNQLTLNKCGLRLPAMR